MGNCVRGIPKQIRKQNRQSTTSSDVPSIEAPSIPLPEIPITPGVPQSEEPVGDAPALPVLLQEIYVAMYTYEARGNSELSFSKGERLMILDNSDEDWWNARHCESQREGYVPMLYIKLASTLDSQEWYFGKISRLEAIQLLMSSYNSIGSFLIRESESGVGYTLSARTEDTSQSRRHVVKHFRIPRTQEGYPYIMQEKPFYTLPALVKYYSENSDSIFYSLLRKPCKRNKPILHDISFDARDKWEIDRSELEFIERKGHGSFGEVWLGSWNNNVEVAIKTLKEGTMTVQAFMEEAHIMKRLKHPNILVLYAVCTKEEPLLIITEYMCEGSLLDYLRRNGGQNLSFSDQLYIAAQVASGMAHLEVLNLIHRDLAARNVLVGTSMTCKVADFGLARALEGDSFNFTTGKFPVKWTAPEALTHHTFTVKSDVWSFGILVMEILTHGGAPYPGMSKSEVISFTANGGRMNKPMNCPDALYELIYKCWMPNPIERPTFDYIHETLSNYNISTERSYAES